MDLLVGLAILVGLVGIVVPVLPGSLLIAVALLVWAIDTGTVTGWVVLGIALLLLAAGWAATYVVAGKRVSDAGVPRRSLLVAGLAGIVGFFVIPVIGLLVFFPLALFGMEYLRLRDVAQARGSAMVALKATALGMVIELGLACIAAATWLLAAVFGG
ncbi:MULTISPECIES: DUF456 domain-containing protein [unclassified Actinotalea]|uniref:DUF456 domain-containing protein n=1 Tax=unclassified Actinotalea TaxID=2638618 RepID=UPI002104624B|nr:MULTISPECIES: DUF456 domain-containing protein [unclassified Actinotalea]